MNLCTVPLGGRSLPFFYEKLSDHDSFSIAQQMRGRKCDATLILGTADRCRFGCPRVVVCTPHRAFVPFPTSFWLTCPWLVRFIGEIESGGGVGDLERWIEGHTAHEWIPFNLDHQKVRLALLPPVALRFLRQFKIQVFERLRSGGVGGIRYGSEVRVKCVHLQTASWLALRRHPGRKWLEAKGAGGDCGGSMRKICAGCTEG